MAISQARASASVSAKARGKLKIGRRRHDEVNVRDWVQEQFPEFIQEDYPRMIEFIKAYYTYISTDTENGEIDDIKDIDFTSGDYLLKLRKEFSYNSTQFNFLSETEFIRHAKEFYASKGSEESIKFLFRVMFNDEVELEYPSERIFTPSSAHWQQLKSIKVNIQNNSLTPDNFIGSYLTIRNSKNIKQVIEVDDVVDLTDKGSSSDPSVRFEIFFPTELFIDVSVGDVVIGDSFEATIIPSISSVKVIDPGKNFRVGQVVQLDGTVGLGAVGVITNVSKTGGIRNVKILQFGKNYSSNFYVNVKPEGIFADAGQTFASVGSATYNAAIDDLQTDYQERISVLKGDYVANDSPGTTGDPNRFYAAPGYFGEFLSQYRNIQTYFAEEQTFGLLYCSVGAVARYPGTFLNKVGAASDYSVLQDGEYFQTFSYKIKSRQDINKYKDVLTTFAHPAGLKMFSEYSVEDTFDTEATIELTEVQSDFVGNLADVYTIDTVSRTSNVVTVKLRESSLIDLGDTIRLEAVETPSLTGTHVITAVVNPNTIRFNLSGSDITEVADSGRVVFTTKNFLSAKVKAEVFTYGVFPEWNALESHHTTNSTDSTASSTLLVERSLAHTQETDSESFKAYAGANASVVRQSIIYTQISGTMNASYNAVAVSVLNPISNQQQSMSVHHSLSGATTSYSATAVGTLSLLSPAFVLDFTNQAYLT